MFIGQILVLVVVLVVASGQNEEPTVRVPDGKILGGVSHTANENITFYTFRGIPYAKPPTGNLRFSAPVQNDPWNGTFNGTYQRDVCTQMLGAIVVGSEDCLHVNVYTTDISGSLPVMVSIYGGSFQTGTNAMELYRPDYFLEKDVIFVAINYRLGIFGFLSTNDSSASGNWGLKDQVLALKWVKNNIQYFGGNPDNINIFGESAGAASIAYLMQSNLTQGLYNSAIMQSGSSLCQWALSRSPMEKASSVGQLLFNASLTSQTLVDKLREVDYKTLKLAETNVTIQSYLTDNLLASLPWGPVQESNVDGAFFTTSSKSWEEYSKGNFQQVPMIIGFNSNETGGLTGYLPYILRSLEGNSADRFAPIDLTSNISTRLYVGTSVRTYYFGTLPLSTQPTNFSSFINFDLYIRPTREQATQASKYVNVYYYKFSYKGLLGDPNNRTTGVGHAEELNYMFNLNNSVSSQDKTVRDQMVTLWTNFVKTGNPTPDPTSYDTVLGTTIWEANNAITNASNIISYLSINGSLTMDANPSQEDWAFYQDLYNTYGDNDYTTY